MNIEAENAVIRERARIREGIMRIAIRENMADDESDYKWLDVEDVLKIINNNHE